MAEHAQYAVWDSIVDEIRRAEMRDRAISPLDYEDCEDSLIPPNQALGLEEIHDLDSLKKETSLALLPLDTGRHTAFKPPRTSILPLSTSPSMQDSVDDIWNAVRTSTKLKKP